MNKSLFSLFWFRIFVGAVIVILAAALRLYHLGTASFWLDEMFSIWVAKQPNVVSLFWDSNPFLYHVLLRGWIHLVGDTEFWIRLLSCLLSIGSVVVLLKFDDFESPFSSRAVAAFLLAINPVSIQYAQEARMYALFEFLTVYNLVYFSRILAVNQGLNEFRRPWKMWSLTLFLLALTHLYAIFLIFLELGWILSRKTQWSWRAWLLAFVGSSLLLIGFFQLTGFQSQYLEWQKLRYSVQSWYTDWAEILKMFGWGQVWGVVGTLAAIFVLAKKMAKDLSRFALLLIGVTFVSLTVAAAISHRSLLLDRYVIFLLPLVCWQVANLPLRQALRWLPAGLLTIAFGVHLPHQYDNWKSPWKMAEMYIATYPNPIVFNTRTLGIREPYFSKDKIQVDLWTPNAAGINHLADLADAGKNVFLLENYWGGLTYWKPLREEMEKRHFKVYEETFKDGDAEPIYCMRIKR